MWRLAEAYVERESRAARVMTYHEIERDRAKSAGNADRAREEAAAAAKAATARDGARGKAILYYSTLAREHPNACFGGGACIDKVLYYLAYELESASRREEARQVYGEILQRFPQSRYVPNAHLVFAEALFDEAMGDPRKLAAAEQAYREVLRVPPPDNQVAPFAHYKLSYVYQNQGNAAKALAEMAEAIEVSQQYPKILHADNLARSARADIAALYVAAGDPRTALAFLARLSGDPPGKDESLHRMLDRLVESYLDAGKLEPAILVSLDWLQRGAGAKTCDVARRIDASLAKAPPPATLQAAIMGSAPLADARARCAAKP
jgi:TolA-binding protein